MVYSGRERDYGAVTNHLPENHRDCSATGSRTMTPAKRIEYQITRQLLQRRVVGGAQQGGMHTGAAPADLNRWADRLIAVLAVTTGLLILGSYLEELLWAAVAATTVVTLR